MRPLEKVEAKITSPIGLSIRSGRIAPIARYRGSMIFLNLGIKIPSPKNYPERNAQMSKEKH